MKEKSMPVSCKDAPEGMTCRCWLCSARVPLLVRAAAQSNAISTVDCACSRSYGEFADDCTPVATVLSAAKTVEARRASEHASSACISPPPPSSDPQPSPLLSVTPPLLYIYRGGRRRAFRSRFRASPRLVRP
ncbi:unnamed protein product, partial [Iphiclides podalirius]